MRVVNFFAPVTPRPGRDSPGPARPPGPQDSHFSPKMGMNKEKYQWLMGISMVNDG